MSACPDPKEPIEKITQTRTGNCPEPPSPTCKVRIVAVQSGYSGLLRSVNWMMRISG